MNEWNEKDFHLNLWWWTDLGHLEIYQQLQQWDLEKIYIKKLRWGPNVENINVKNNKNINVEFWR